jgi:hypothetical protein
MIRLHLTQISNTTRRPETVWAVYASIPRRRVLTTSIVRLGGLPYHFRTRARAVAALRRVGATVRRGGWLALSRPVSFYRPAYDPRGWRF